MVIAHRSSWAWAEIRTTVLFIVAASLIYPSWAGHLRNRRMTLEGFLKSFGLAGKIDYEPTGRVSEKGLAYGRRDTERTVALLKAMKREYDGFPIDLPPERAMSAASITKAFRDHLRSLIY